MASDTTSTDTSTRAMISNYKDYYENLDHSIKIDLFGILTLKVAAKLIACGVGIVLYR
jgi:hypothetical protein